MTHFLYSPVVGPGGAARIGQLVRATGFFSAEECAIARELADDGEARGPASHYQFELAHRHDTLAGYACFGRIPCTRASWDLYWICVDPAEQRHGLGQALLRRVESRVAAAGGTRLYADTSSRAQYRPTRRFYERAGYQSAASLEDFYAPGDGKVVYLKVLAASPGVSP